MIQKTKTMVRIAGREYTVRAYESEEYIHKVAIYVNRKMESVDKSQSGLSTSMVAVLTAINLGDEVLKLQLEVEALQNQIKELQDTIKKPSSPTIYDVSRKGKL